MSKKISNSIKDFKCVVNDKFINKAIELEPKIYENIRKPMSIVNILKEGKDWKISSSISIDELKNMEFYKNDKVCLDFGNHYVGYITFTIKPIGSPPDAPAHIRIKLGEHLCEIGEEASSYDGMISSSWIQEEFLHIDVLPYEVKLPRRYAFRYIEIKVLDTSPKYRLVIEDIYCKTVTSANIENVEKINSSSDIINKIDTVSLKTLEDCMQSVFEDGPKRDRRLWIGDLRLQALTNYLTFKNNDLVKRCLYLFAGVTQNDGKVGACLFLQPNIIVDDTSLFDYSLFFISCLYDYYKATNDKETLNELWDTAYRQIEISETRLDNNYILKDSDDWWCFLDWNDELNKQAGAQAIFIYTLKQALELAKILNDIDKEKHINELLNKLVNASIKYLWDNDKNFFVSGKDKQISWVSQIWFILAEVFDKEKNAEILDNLFFNNPKIGMVTPYMYHHLIDALYKNNRREKAIQCMLDYWGSMVEDGADCFWELYNKDDKYFSPYGSNIINSYCHAWSCTPSYFIRTYNL